MAKPERERSSQVFPWLWQAIQQGTTRSARTEPNTSPESSETPERVLYEAAARFLDLQVSTSDVLDNKAANIFSVGSTILPVTFGLLTLAPNSIPQWSIVSLFGALGAYIVLLVCAWRASAYRGLEYRPDIPTLEAYSQNYSGDVLLWWVATEYMESTNENRAVLERKARWTGAANTALLVEGLLLSIAAILALL
jgi:hypothetical protein